MQRLYGDRTAPSTKFAGRLDGRVASPYLSPAMARLFLTLLALLTGLVAQVSPAQTIMRGGESEIGVTLGAARAEHRAAPSAHLAQPVVGGQPDDNRCTILMRVPQQDCPPATYIGVDRSLE